MPVHARSTDRARLGTIEPTTREGSSDGVVRHPGPRGCQQDGCDAAVAGSRARAASHGPCEFTLLVPNATHGLHKVVDPEDQTQTEAETTIELALPLLEEAAGGPVDAMIGVPEPLAAIQDAVNLHGFDEIIISTLPTRVSKWLRLDLPHKAAGLGLPVTTVTARSREGVEV